MNTEGANIEDCAKTRHPRCGIFIAEYVKKIILKTEILNGLRKKQEIVMLTTEQKAAAWDRLKKVWEKGRDDEENDTESRDICRVLAEQMQVIEEKVSSVDAENDTTAVMDKAFGCFQDQPDTKEELDFIIRVAPDRRWDGEARGFFAGWNAAKYFRC